jgi:hypothetical protein
MLNLIDPTIRKHKLHQHNPFWDHKFPSTSPSQQAITFHFGRQEQNLKEILNAVKQQTRKPQMPPYIPSPHLLKIFPHLVKPTKTKNAIQTSTLIFSTSVSQWTFKEQALFLQKTQSQNSCKCSSQKKCFKIATAWTFLSRTCLILAMSALEKKTTIPSKTLLRFASCAAFQGLAHNCNHTKFDTYLNSPVKLWDSVLLSSTTIGVEVAVFRSRAVRCQEWLNILRFQIELYYPCWHDMQLTSLELQQLFLFLKDQSSLPQHISS